MSSSVLQLAAEGAISGLAGKTLIKFLTFIILQLYHYLSFIINKTRVIHSSFMGS